MGWQSAKTRHKILILQYWNRLCLLPHDRITRYVFEWDKTNFSNKHGTWSNCVKLILQEIGLDESFLNCSPINIDYAKSVLIDSDRDEWDNRRYKSDKLRYYNLYKYDKTCADYVKMNVSKYQRSVFAQFRCGILPLEIEVGRYKNIDLKERLCKLCNLNQVEDEIHFLCDCLIYSIERNALFHQAYPSNSLFSEFDSLEKFVYLMSNHERAVLNFVNNAFKKRQSHLAMVPVSNI